MGNFFLTIGFGFFGGPYCLALLIAEGFGYQRERHATGNNVGMFSSLDGVFGFIWLAVAVLAGLLSIPWTGLDAFWIGPAIACSLGSLLMLPVALR